MILAKDCCVMPGFCQPQEKVAQRIDAILRRSLKKKCMICFVNNLVNNILSSEHKEGRDLKNQGSDEQNKCKLLVLVIRTNWIH
jgi:hypothetical protein